MRRGTRRDQPEALERARNTVNGLIRELAEHGDATGFRDRETSPVSLAGTI